MAARDYVAVDRKLAGVASKAGEELARHRWHWTLDESNPGRVSFSEYGRSVGVAHQNIAAMANGYAAFMGTGEGGPGQPVTLTDHIELAKVGADRKEAVKAIAAARGVSPSTVTANHRPAVKATLDAARDRAERKGTTVAEEVAHVAEWAEKSRRARVSEKEDRAKRSMFRYVEIEGHLGAMLARGRRALEAAEGVDFSEDELEFLTAALAKVRALLGLIDMRIAGAVDVDWDGELEKLTEGDRA